MLITEHRLMPPDFMDHFGTELAADPCVSDPVLDPANMHSPLVSEHHTPARKSTALAPPVG